MVACVCNEAAKAKHPGSRDQEMMTIQQQHGASAHISDDDEELLGEIGNDLWSIALLKTQQPAGTKLPDFKNLLDLSLFIINSAALFNKRVAQMLLLRNV